MSAATIANWLANLAVARTFLDLVDLLGRPPVFFVYAALTLGAFLFAGPFVPGTRGLRLEAVEALWVRRAGAKRPTIIPAKRGYESSSTPPCRDPGGLSARPTLPWHQVDASFEVAT